MNCIICDTNMVEDEHHQSDLLITINGVTHSTDPIRYICPKCGLILSIANKEFLKNTFKEYHNE